MKNKYFRLSLFILAAVASLLSYIGCGGNESGGDRAGGRKKGEMMFPVETVRVQSQSVTYSIYAVGSVEAFEIVQITSRVSGVVDKVLFSEGARAQSNQVLVEIETERYRLTVESARATLEKAKAAKADAEAGLKRRKDVVVKNPGLIPGEEIETWQTKVRTATSEMALAQAQLNQADLNLHDAQVRAPVGGIIQTRTVQTGQYVQPGTVLATMIRRDPLLVRFKVPEQDAARLRPGMKAFFQVKDEKAQFGCIITHVAAAADESSRMAAVTAEVTDNNKEALRAGAFAEIQIPVGDAKNAPVIPQVAVRPSEKGFLAYVVENGKAVERVLTLGMKTSDGRVEVVDGIKPGEILVIRGAEALKNGDSVRIARPDEIPGSEGAPINPKTGKRKGAGK